MVRLGGAAGGATGVCGGSDFGAGGTGAVGAVVLAAGAAGLLDRVGTFSFNIGVAGLAAGTGSSSATVGVAIGSATLGSASAGGSAKGASRFTDIVYGEQQRSYSEIEDLVLLRSDGHPLYNLSVVLDDIGMGITHVIRGQDHLTNTHKQILLYQAFGAEIPQFAHLPLILAPNKAKLSKRKHGEVVSLTTYRDRGFVPAAFRNFLALLGWSPPEGKELLSRDELVKEFSLEAIGRANAVFNFHENDPRRWTDDKALWMNAEYIRTMPLPELLPMVKTELRLEKLWREEYDDDEREWFAKAVDLIRQRFFTLKDFSAQGRAYFSEDYDFDQSAVAKNLKKEPRLRDWLPAFAARLEQVEPFTSENVEAALRQFADELNVKAGLFINAARTMLTGQAVGPSMFEVFELMGRERSVNRLRSGVPWFDAMEELGDV